MGEAKASIYQGDLDCVHLMIKCGGEKGAQQ
jgi:hypothetical protein